MLQSRKYVGFEEARKAEVAHKRQSMSPLAAQRCAMRTSSAFPGSAAGVYRSPPAARQAREASRAVCGWRCIVVRRRYAASASGA